MSNEDKDDIELLLEEIRNRPKELIVEEKVDEETVKSLEKVRNRHYKTDEERIAEMTPAERGEALYQSKENCKLWDKGARTSHLYKVMIEQERQFQQLIYDMSGGPDPI